MLDPRPDEAALDALLARYVPGSMLDSNGTAELVAHCKRMRAEREALLADLSQAVALAQQQSEALTTVLAHCDEARRVARWLAANAHDSCSHGPCNEHCLARQAALAYPEVPHG